MELDRDVEHNFNLEGMRVKDWFLGCNKCWFQLPVRVAGAPICPKCRNRLSILDVKEGDV